MSVLVEGAPVGRKVQLIRRDMTPGSPRFGQDIMVMDILGPGKGNMGVTMGKGFAGLYHAPRTQVRENYAYQEGSTPGDFPRVDERLIDLQLITQGTTPMDWERVDSRLWDMLTFTEDCYLRVFSEYSEAREIKVRLERKPVDQMELDPGVTKIMKWAVTLLACDPWWYSRDIVYTWKRSMGTLQGDGVTWAGTVPLKNPADQDSWLEWVSATIEQPETWTLPDGVTLYPAGHPKAGQIVTHTLPVLGVGKTFRVQTHPLEETLQTMDDSQKWAEMEAEEFLYPLKKKMYEAVDAPISLKGGTADSEIAVFITQKWDRPWGGH